MESQKPLQFDATAGSYFVVFLVTLIAAYVPFFGWAFAFNYMSEWAVKNSHVNGKKVKYQAGYGETLKFIFVNTLLVIITLGIYVFWFTPKSYRYVADHVAYDNSDGPVTPAPVQAPSVPTAGPTPPVVSPTPPTTPASPVQ